MCGRLAQVVPPIPVMFLQHPGERRNPIGTLRMTQMQLQGSQVFAGTDFSKDADFLRTFAEHRARSVVLFPTDDAKDVRELQGRTDLTMWVIDGTWSQAGKVWRRNPMLHDLPAYRLAPSEPGRYRIRREPAEHCLSTIEATAQMLDLIAGEPGRHAALLSPFDGMVETQLRYIAEGGGRPRRKSRKRTRTVKLPPVENLVLVHADALERDQLHVWNAYRPSTGECFSVPAAEARARMDAISKPNDIWCAWGPFSTKLWGEGAAQLFDLKDALTDYHKKRLGYVESAVERLNLAVTPLGLPERGGRRLSCLAALFLHATTQCVSRALT